MESLNLVKLREDLVRRPLAISTMAREDVEGAFQLQDYEYLRWGVGPSLSAGSIVAIYVPKGARMLPDDEQGRIKHIFSVARDTYPATDEFQWNNVVFLHKRVSLEAPLLIDLLKQPAVIKTWRLPNSNFRGVGKLRSPLKESEAQIFWDLVFDKNKAAAASIKKSLLTENYVPRDIEQKPPEKDRTFEYDVALSFAGEDRTIARELANACLASGIRIFFDEFEVANLWGKDLYETLADIYQNRARYCIPILSAHYARKTWTNHERKNIQARALVDSDEYILPLRLDNTEIPGIRGTIAYLDLRQIDIKDVVTALRVKLDKKDEEK
ncbi:MAG: TIR domain-containing protein [Candidatus Aminicenantes bacterium]|nr:MAG: TIR domain-containing protein [Candidatus Aminicenantes bacterium]